MASSTINSYQPPKMHTLRNVLHSTSSSAIIDVRSVDSPSASITITHQTLRNRVACYASQLTKTIPPSSVVSIVMPNSTSCVISFLSVTSAGYIAAPLNQAYTTDEFKFYLQDSEARAVVVTEQIASEDSPIRLACQSLDIPMLFFPMNLCEQQNEVDDDDITFPTENDFVPSSETTALFLHTSGTTSRPKGVPLSHLNLITSISNISSTYELNENDRTLLVMPLFHVHGLMAAMLSTLATGGCIIIPPSGKFSASKFWPSIHIGKATWYTAVPTMHQILLSRADIDFVQSGYNEKIQNELGGLRFIRSCSASLAPSVLDRVEKTFGAPVLEAYAMTEASHQMTSNPLPKFGTRKAGSVGLPQNVELAILNDKNEVMDNGNENIGEICIKGKNVTNGYHKNEKANASSFTDGWFHTGDQGWIDSEGYLRLTGRIKELVNRGGEKISPVEVDAAMLAHTSVKEAVAFAVPDEKYGEEVNAAVILKDGTENVGEVELTEFLKSRLASFKIPKKFFICGDLPRTATGKIQRRIVAKHFLDEFEKDEQK